MDFKDFKKSYWDYYLELEERMEETRRYVQYDESNFKTYSSNYLMLLQSVCSEIDVVGKEIAAYFNPDFDKDDGTKPINRWWHEIQDKLTDVNREIVFADAYTLKPWDKYKVVIVVDQQMRNGKLVDVTRYNLHPSEDGISYSTPKWWTAYNNIKHKRLKSDNEGVNYKKANLLNLSNAFAALFLLESEFMLRIGTIEDLVYCKESELFGRGGKEKLFLQSIMQAVDEGRLPIEI